MEKKQAKLWAKLGHGRSRQHPDIRSPPPRPMHMPYSGPVPYCRAMSFDDIRRYVHFYSHCNTLVVRLFVFVTSAHLHCPSCSPLSPPSYSSRSHPPSLSVYVSVHSLSLSACSFFFYLLRQRRSGCHQRRAEEVAMRTRGRGREETEGNVSRAVEGQSGERCSGRSDYEERSRRNRQNIMNKPITKSAPEQ